MLEKDKPTYLVQMILSDSLPEPELASFFQAEWEHLQLQSAKLRSAANFVVRTIAHTHALEESLDKSS